MDLYILVYFWFVMALAYSLSRYVSHPWWPHIDVSFLFPHHVLMPEGMTPQTLADWKSSTFSVFFLFTSDLCPSFSLTSWPPGSPPKNFVLIRSGGTCFLIKSKYFTFTKWHTRVETLYSQDTDKIKSTELNVFLVKVMLSGTEKVKFTGHLKHKQDRFVLKCFTMTNSSKQSIALPSAWY